MIWIEHEKDSMTITWSLSCLFVCASALMIISMMLCCRFSPVRCFIIMRKRQVFIFWLHFAICVAAMCTLKDNYVCGVVREGSAPRTMYSIPAPEWNTPWGSAERVEAGPMLDAYYSGLPHLTGILSLELANTSKIAAQRKCVCSLPRVNFK